MQIKDSDDVYVRDVTTIANEDRMDQLSEDIKKGMKEGLIESLFGEFNEFLSGNDLANCFQKTVTSTVKDLFEECYNFLDWNGEICTRSQNLPNVKVSENISDMVSYQLESAVKDCKQGYLEVSKIDELESKFVECLEQIRAVKKEINNEKT